tara:strand:+ start:1131 stop:1325 length:195 start_codon:yes stop_codon:yes gene_type:complete
MVTFYVVQVDYAQRSISDHPSSKKNRAKAELAFLQPYRARKQPWHPPQNPAKLSQLTQGHIFPS